MGHSQNSQTQKRYGDYRTEVVIEAISKSDYKLDFKPLEKSINNFYDNLV